MGLADIRAIRECQFGHSISDVAAAQAALDTLTSEVRAEVAGQGVPDEGITTRSAAHIRVAGAHQTIEIPYGPTETMSQTFLAEHKARYGYVPDAADLIIDMLTVEGIGDTGTKADVLHSATSVQPIRTVEMFCTGGWTKVPMIDRYTLQQGDTVDGPAIITEPTGTNVVETGWRAEVVDEGNLVLSRVTPLKATKAIGTHADPLMLEVFNNLFMNIAEQMGATLANTAYSVNIKERLDFSCAIFNSKGELVANAPHVPVHLGSMGESVRTVLRQNAGKLNPGDVIMMNNPFNGGTHLPDVTVITPVFDDHDCGAPLFYVASRGHHADIGGRTPGSAPPDSRHIDEEGVLIDNVFLVRGGEFQEKEVRAILASGKYPCRNIDQNIADLSAQIAANATGARELSRMVDQFGRDVVQAYMGHVQDNAEECVRRVIDVLKDSSFTYHLDSGAQICVKVDIDHTNRTARIDFSGTSPQDECNYNAPLAISHAAVLYVFRTLVGDDIPLNEGCMKPLDVHVPEGSMINPRYPAAVIAGNTEVSQSITEALYGALGVMAGSQGTMNNFVYGNDVYQNYETICGGTGAGPDFAGTSAVHSHMTNTRMTDPEVLEERFPVRVEEFSIRRGSGGRGAYSGGDGVTRALRFLEPMTVTILSSHRKSGAFGVNGGEAGQPGLNKVVRSDGHVEVLAGNASCQVDVGDVFVVQTPGGGGFGQPE